MRRFEYVAEPIRVLVDVPEELFQALKEEAPDKLRQAIAALAEKTLQSDVEGTQDDGA